MKLTKAHKIAAFILVFVLIVSIFPMPAVANTTEESKATVETEETATIETATETSDGEEAATEPQEMETIPTEEAETIPVESREQAEDPIQTEPASGQDSNEPPVQTEPAEDLTAEADDLGEGESDSDSKPEPDAEVKIITSTYYFQHSGNFSSSISYPKYRNGTLAVSWSDDRSAPRSHTFGANGDGAIEGFYLSPSDYTPQSPLDNDLTVVYCIEPEAHITNHAAYNALLNLDNNSSGVISWGPYGYSRDRRKAIQAAVVYGWRKDPANSALSTTDPRTAIAYQAATQVIVWEIVTGMRKTTGDYGIDTSSSYVQYYDAWGEYQTKLYHLYNGRSEDLAIVQDFIYAYNNISERLARHNTIPSFAKLTPAECTPVDAVYDSSGDFYYKEILDTNQYFGSYITNIVPYGVSYESGEFYWWRYSSDSSSSDYNKLCVHISSSLMKRANGELTLCLTDPGKLQVTDDKWDVWTNADNQQSVVAFEQATTIPCYSKVKGDIYKPVSIKKVTSNIPDAIACITGDNYNPLYTLAGAEFDVYTYSNGTYTNANDHLVTGADGKATCAKEYSIGTTIYLKETKAPSGYLKNTGNSDGYIGPFKVTDGTNEFTVADDPTFDPQVISLTKTNSNGQGIQGAIFKAEFYASTTPSGSPQRTWYFASGSDGKVRFDDAHLAAGYTSSALFKPDGTVSFPLGCVKVEEIKAAPGYILPKDGSQIAYIYITQPREGEPAVAAWSNTSGYMYSLTNTPENATAVNAETGFATMRKSLPAGHEGNLEGYMFNLYCAPSTQGAHDDVTWYGRSGADGRVYVTNETHDEVAAANRVYRFEGLRNGTYIFREILQGKNSKTTKIRIYTTDVNNVIRSDYTYTGSTLTFAQNGDCLIRGIELVGLNGGGTLSIEIENTPIYGEPPTLVKKDASTDLPLEGAIFKVEYYSAETVTGSDMVRSWFLRSDADGYVTLDAAHLVNTSAYLSDDLYDTGKLPIGCMRIEEVEAPEGFKKSDSIGYWYMKLTNPKTFAVSTYWGDEAGNATDDYGDDAYVIDNELYVENMPSNTLTIRKISNGRIKGITFEVRQYVTGHGWLPLGDGTYVTGDGGKIEIPDLPAGTRVQIKEIVQEGSICLSQNPQEITLQIGDNPVYFVNVDISLKIKKECSDGKIDGITFKVEKKVNGSWTLIGSYVTGTDGIIPIATEHLAIGAEFRITETAPQNYVCVNTPDGVQTVTLHAGENVVTFINKPVIKLELYKTSDDGNIKDIEFKLYKRNIKGIFEYVGTYLTDENGYICDEEVLEEGETYKIVETVPTDSFCEEPEKTFTAHLGTNTVRFKNYGIVTLEIIKRTSSADGIVDGFKFKIERLVPQTGSGITVSEQWEQIGGIYVSANGGHIYIDEPGLLRIGDEIRIEEIDLGDYVCTTENPIRRTLVKGENVFEFTNRYDTELLIQKESDDGKIKDITFVVERKKAEGEYSYLGTFKTDDDGQIHIEDIEKDQTYKITETLPYGYETDHVSQEITIRAGTNKVTFVNRLIECSIKIAKVYEGTRVPLKDAGFKLYNERGEELAEGFTNENGELKFERLRVGNYTLKEFQAPPGFELDETEIPITLTPDERDITITRENRIIPGLIRVYKEDDKGRAMKGVTYLLEYSLDDTDTWLPIQVRDADSPVQCGYSTSANIVDGCITTGDDGIAEFAGLAIDNSMHTIKYRLTEVGTQDGYDLLPEPVFEGHLTEEQVELAYKVVNHHVFEMPMTGGNGFTLAAIGSALAVLLAVIILLRLPKKKEDETL